MWAESLVIYYIYIYDFDHSFFRKVFNPSHCIHIQFEWNKFIRSIIYNFRNYLVIANERQTFEYRVNQINAKTFVTASVTFYIHKVQPVYCMNRKCFQSTSYTIQCIGAPLKQFQIHTGYQSILTYSNLIYFCNINVILHAA